MVSILPPEMRGFMSITGYRGIGKSYLAAQADAPENIAFFDFENKGEGIHSQLGFGLYRALTQEATNGPPELYDVAMEAFGNLEKDRYTVVILDNVSPLELALQAGARRNVREYVEQYGLNLKNVMAGRFGGLKSVVNYLVGDQVCSVLHKRGVQLIIATAHIKQRWGAAGPIANKYRMKGADRWQELSILTLALIPGNHVPIPAALVRKEQLGLLTWDGENHQVRRRLPFRIPKCTFAEIRRYLREPADLQNPAEGERPTEEESSPFDEQLTKEQIALMHMVLEKERREVLGAKVEAADSGLLEHVKQLKASGLRLPDIVKDKQVANAGLSMADVARLLNKYTEEE